MHNSSYYNKSKEVNIKPYNGNNQNYENQTSTRRATPFERVGSFNQNPQEGFYGQPNQNQQIYNNNDPNSYNYNTYNNAVTPNTYKQYNNSNSFNKPFFRENVSRFN